MRRFAFIACIALLLVLPIVSFDVTKAQTILTCRPGDVHVLTGRGPALTAVLLRFDTVPVGGSTTDAQGNFKVRLVVGPEAPGDYQVEVETRASHQVLLTAICRVPGPDETDSPISAPTQSTAPSATTTRTATITATTPNNKVAPSATTGSGGSTTTATASATASVSATTTATNQGGATNTPTATGQRTTATTGSTSTTKTATATRTATSGASTGNPELTVDIENDQPAVGDELLTYGDLVDANNDGIASISVTVTYTFSGGSGQWCSATTDSDGYWECSGKVTAAMKSKDVTLTAKVTVNGRTLEQEATMTPGDEQT